MKRCRLKRNNFQIKNKMSKENETLDNAQNGNDFIADVRHSAMKWWNTLSSAGKTRMCDIHTELVGSVRRWETLTGREIQMLYESEHCA